jgi:hypothetical protein
MAHLFRRNILGHISLRASTLHYKPHDKPHDNLYLSRRSMTAIVIFTGQNIKISKMQQLHNLKRHDVSHARDS